MILNDTYTLSNGMKIPKLGLGTWEIPDDKAAQAVRDAVKSVIAILTQRKAMIMKEAWAKASALAAFPVRNCL